MSTQPNYNVKQSIRDLARINKVSQDDLPQYVSQFIRKYKVSHVSHKTLLSEAMDEMGYKEVSE